MYENKKSLTSSTFLVGTHRSDERRGAYLSIHIIFDDDGMGIVASAVPTIAIIFLVVLIVEDNDDVPFLYFVANDTLVLVPSPVLAAQPSCDAVVFSRPPPPGTAADATRDDNDDDPAPLVRFIVVDAMARVDGTRCFIDATMVDASPSSSPTSSTSTSSSSSSSGGGRCRIRR